MFSGITGHDRQLRFLTRVMTSGRLGHAYLFSGPEGIGKATVARAMAAGLLCKADAGRVPCGRCPGCVQFASGNHPDFLHIVPQGTFIKIAQIRSLKKQLAFSPFSGGMRVILLEEAQSMRREAANSLLKMLEEPPPDNIFLLIASDAEPILPTVLSRCQMVSFAPLTDDLAADVIGRLSPELTRRQCITLARITGGAPGRALTLEAGDAPALFERIVAVLAAPPGEEAAVIEESLYLAAAMAQLKDELGLLFSLLKILFKDALLLKLDASLSVGAAAINIKELQRIRERWNLSRLSDKVDAVDYAEKALAGNCNRGLICEVLMLQLVADVPPLKAMV